MNYVTPRLAVGTKLSLYGKELEVQIAAMSGYVLVDEDGGYYAIDSDLRVERRRI